MDKETALYVLGLSATASLEQAKIAYRQLAKKHHPDVIEKKSNPSPQSESRMKDINLAFRFLVPYLKSESTILKKEKKDKNKPFREKKPVTSAITQKNIFSTLKSIFIQTVSGIGQKQRSINTMRSRHRKKSSSRFKKNNIKKHDTAIIEEIYFDDVLNTAAGNGGEGNPLNGFRANPMTMGIKNAMAGEKSKRFKPKSSIGQGRQTRSPYSRYRQYMKLKKKYQSISGHSSKNTRIERITKIDPISPVGPIAKD